MVVLREKLLENKAVGRLSLARGKMKEKTIKVYNFLLRENLTKKEVERKYFLTNQI